MVYEKQRDLLERKACLGWTNREVANVLDCTPSVASSKLNGFIVLTPEERRRLELAMCGAEKSITTSVSGAAK